MRWPVDRLTRKLRGIKAMRRKGRNRRYEASGDDDEGHKNEAFARAGKDVSAGLQMVHEDMDNLLKKATKVTRNTEAWRKITKEFVDRLDPIVEECNKALNDRMVRKIFKRMWRPKKINIDSD
ncbi:hypothetical protein Sjap_020054 [Stephania japonica]|uniref:Uncharacterized protein n=1 Tax=Stephania japonica TaxID=461633 RepID=A0AAP0F2P3_9MAGN